jgi:glutaminase
MLTKQLPILGMTCAAMLLPSFADARDPQAREFQRLVNEAHERYQGLADGKNADYIPILTTVPSDLFGVVIVDADGGRVYAAGDTDYKFSIQSVSKPFTAALVMAQQGPQAIHEKIGVEPTGLPFNSRMAIELYPEARSVNPLVNAGAIAAVSLVKRLLSRTAGTRSSTTSTVTQERR